MTVQKLFVKNIYSGNNRQTIWPITFDWKKDHPECIKVYIRSNGVLSQTTNFNIQKIDSTGEYQIVYSEIEGTGEYQTEYTEIEGTGEYQVLYPVSGRALASGDRIIIARELPLEQALNLVNQGPFFAEDVELTFDEVVMMIQQLNERLGRSLKVGIDIDSDTEIDVNVPVPTDDKNYGIRITKEGFSLVNDPSEVYDDTVAIKNQVEVAKNEIASYDNYVYVGTTRPTMANAYAWINPQEDDGLDLQPFTEAVNNLTSRLGSKQDNLIAGQNIRIAADGKTISATVSVDAYTKNETDTLLNTKANVATTYSKDDIDGQFATVNGDIDTLYCDIANRLEKNQGAENSGKYLKVGDDGNVTCDTVSGGVDVQINGESITVDGVANIPLASDKQTPGLLNGYSLNYGIAINRTGQPYIYGANNPNIDTRKNYVPITPANLDYAVKCALTDGKGQAYTDEEKASARARLGVAGYKKIIDVTIDNDTTKNIIFEVDKDGNNIKTKKICVRITSPKCEDYSDSANGYVSVRGNRDTAFSSYGAYYFKNKTKALQTIVYVTANGDAPAVGIGYNPIIQISSIYGYAVYSNAQIIGGNVELYADYFNKLRIDGNGLLPNGMHIEIWGIDYE